MKKYVKDRAEDFIINSNKYTNSDSGAVNATILEVNKWKRTTDPDACMFRGVPGEEDKLKLSLRLLHQNNFIRTCTR